LLLVLLGTLADSSPLWRFVAPVVAGAFLAATGAILIADLDHPERFHLIFTRPQWRSWLVRGAFIIAGYATVLALHFLVSFSAESARWQRALLAPGLPLAVLTAIYTAYLFAQAKARDPRQNPSLPPPFLVQALLAGSAAMLPLAMWLDAKAAGAMADVLAASSIAHLLLVGGEVTLTHPTAHARLAVEEMTGGRYRAF